MSPSISHIKKTITDYNMYQKDSGLGKLIKQSGDTESGNKTENKKDRERERKPK